MMLRPICSGGLIVIGVWWAVLGVYGRRMLDAIAIIGGKYALASS
jgi:hypothetical protein